MKVLLINTFSKGGASKACIRLHEGFLQNGVDSELLFKNFNSDQEIKNIQVYKPLGTRTGFMKRLLRKIIRITGIGRSEYEMKIKKQIKKLIPDVIEWFSFPDTGIDLSVHPLFMEADIINIHWIADFIDFSFLRNSSKPIVWTLHDMNAFTGGCHYSGACMQYLSGCSICPQLSLCEDNTFASRNFKIKFENLKSIKNLNIVSPSKWLMDLSRSSPLLGRFPHYHIPNGIDPCIFQPVDKTRARQNLNLPADRKIFLFIADDLTTKRKGYSLLKAGLEKLASEDVVLCSVGKSGTGSIINSNLIELGVIRTEKEMSLVYSAADLFVIPSIEDNLPNTVIEALLCGLPVTGFRVGGIIDMITDGVNGYLASKVNVDELVSILRKYLNGEHLFNSEEIRKEAILKYGISEQVKSYKALYEKLLIK